MNRRAFLRLAGTAVVATSIATPNVFAQSPIDLNSDLEAIRAQFNMPALTGCFVRGDAVAAIGAVGKRAANQEVDVTQNDLWHLGSCTKSMTATLTAILAQEEVLSLDTTVAEALPDYLNDIRSEYHDMTFRHLYAHRAGLPGNNFPTQYGNLQSQYWSYSGDIRQQRLDLTRAVMRLEPTTTPGSAYDYSNLGYIIGGAMLEEITGQTWEDLMNEKLFAPLGMESAGFGAPGTPGQTDQPWGHTSNNCSPLGPGPAADNPPILGPAGRVHSTMQDWAKYIALHLQGSRSVSGLILDPSVILNLQEDTFGQGYAQGWQVTSRSWAGGRTLVHSGSNTLWMAIVWIAPNRNAAFMAVANCGSDNAFSAIDSSIVMMINRFLS